MSDSIFPNRVTPIWLRLLLLVALLAPLFGAPATSSVALAQAIPPACLSDSGNPQIPQMVGAWTLVLNFNHPANASYTRGCLTTRTGPGANQVNFSQVQCAIVNNVSGALVGGGQANFNGQFWIECPALPPVPTLPGNTQYENFYVYGRTAFPVAGGQSTLFAHPDVSFKANIDANWHVTLTSRYGQTVFANQDNNSVAGTFPQLFTQVYNKTGTHYLNQQPMQPTATVSSFPYNANATIRIGDKNEYWTLFELVVDPGPRPQCCFNP
ncbi:MAG: hypothetical protein KDE53_23925 [Caldilineaceae bacterium]|nr:hypothetical protein [Caldilineaceae bacterium]